MADQTDSRRRPREGANANGADDDSAGGDDKRLRLQCPLYNPNLTRSRADYARLSYDLLKAPFGTELCKAGLEKYADSAAKQDATYQNVGDAAWQQEWENAKEPDMIASGFGGVTMIKDFLKRPYQFLDDVHRFIDRTKPPRDGVVPYYDKDGKVLPRREVVQFSVLGGTSGVTHMYCLAGNRAVSSYYNPHLIDRHAPLVHEKMLVGGGREDITPFVNGDDHRRRKAWIMNAMSDSCFRKYLPVIDACTQEFVSSWASRGHVRMEDECKRIGVDLLLRNVIGFSHAKTASTLPEVVEILDCVRNAFNGLPIDLPTFLYHKALKARKALGAMYGARIADLSERQRQAGAANGPVQDDCIMGYLVWARQSDAEQGGDMMEWLGDDMMVAECLHMSSASTGMYPAVVFISMVLGDSANKDIVDKCRAEIAALGLKSNETPSLEQINDMQYCNQLIREVLRVYPFGPNMFTGLTKKDCIIDGYKVKGGCKIMAATMPTGYDPEVYSEPMTFNPDRFASSQAQDFDGPGDGKPPPQCPMFAFITHGGGEPHNDHRCAGERLFRVWCKLFILRMLGTDTDKQEFYLDPAGQDQDLDYTQWLNPMPKGGVTLSFTPPASHEPMPQDQTPTECLPQVRVDAEVAQDRQEELNELDSRMVWIDKLPASITTVDSRYPGYSSDKPEVLDLTVPPFISWNDQRLLTQRLYTKIDPIGRVLFGIATVPKNEEWTLSQKWGLIKGKLMMPWNTFVSSIRDKISSGFEFVTNAAGSVGHALASLLWGEHHDKDDDNAALQVEKLFTQHAYSAFERPQRSIEHWCKDDAEFARERLGGVNCFAIKKWIADVNSLPKDMPKDLHAKVVAACNEKRLFWCDYSVLKAATVIPSGRFLSKPVVFYEATSLSVDGQLMPLGIKLEPEVDAPAAPWFQPVGHDATQEQKNAWLLAKMTAQSADASHHQCVAHLSTCHLMAETFVVAFNRNVSSRHPLFKLLMPHMNDTLMINEIARVDMLAPGHMIDETMAGGRLGSLQIISKTCTDWTMAEWDFAANISKRNLTRDDLPFDFPYRDDAKCIDDAIRKFVHSIIDVYYVDDQAIQQDTEINNWVMEVYNKLEKTFGLNEQRCPNKMTTKVDLVTYISRFIFAVTVQHWTVNIPQWDAYGFLPGYPTHMCRQPNRDLAVAAQHVVASLPTPHDGYNQLGMAHLLSLPSDNCLLKPLGDSSIYAVAQTNGKKPYFFESRHAQLAADQFRLDLSKASVAVADNAARRRKAFLAAHPDAEMAPASVLYGNNPSRLYADPMFTPMSIAI